MSSSDGHAATREFCFVAFVTAFRAGRLAVGATSQWSWPNIGSGSGAVGQRPVCCNQDDCDAITIVESLRRRGDKTQNTVIDYDAPCTACIQCSFYISFYFVLIKLTVPCNYLILAQQWFRLSSATQCRLRYTVMVHDVHPAWAPGRQTITEREACSLQRFGRGTPPSWHKNV